MFKYIIKDYTNKIIYESNAIYSNRDTVILNGYDHLEALEKIDNNHYSIEIIEE